MVDRSRTDKEHRAYVTTLTETQVLCERATGRIDPRRLASIPALLVESGQASRDISGDLTRFAIVRELLNRMATWTDHATAARGQARDHLAAKQRERLDVRRAGFREQIKKIEQNSVAGAQRSEAEAAELEAHGDTEEAQHLRDIRRGRLEISEMQRAAAAEITDASVRDEEEINDLFTRYHDVRHQYEDIRRRSLHLRRLARVAHPLLVAALGAGIGVVAVQVMQDWAEGVHVAWAWAVGIAAWALLDYLLEPWLHRALTRRSLRLITGEVTATFDAWQALLAFEHHCTTNLAFLQDPTAVRLLPDWTVVTAHLDLDRLSGDWELRHRPPEPD